MDVHLRELRYFVTVAEHLHFTRAAEALYISQPALSKQIRVLERQLRTVLFERNRRAVALTPAGQALLDGAQPVLRAWQDAERKLADAAASSTASLVVGISTGMGRGLLPAIRARLAAAAPAARLQIRQVPWGDPTGGLAAASSQDRTDAALVWLPLPDPDRFSWLDVATEPRRLALPAGHRLADQASIDMAELLDEPFLALPPESGPSRDYWLALEAREGQPAVIGAEVASTDETIEALEAGLGVCLIADGNAALLERAGIVTRPVRGIDPSCLVLAWRQDDDRPLLLLLRDVVAEIVASRA